MFSRRFVKSFPVLSTGLMIVAILSIASGPVLDTVTRGRREMKLLAYLSQPAIRKDQSERWTARRSNAIPQNFDSN